MDCLTKRGFYRRDALNVQTLNSIAEKSRAWGIAVKPPNINGLIIISTIKQEKRRQKNINAAVFLFHISLLAETTTKATWRSAQEISAVEGEA